MTRHVKQIAHCINIYKLRRLASIFKELLIQYIAFIDFLDFLLHGLRYYANFRKATVTQSKIRLSPLARIQYQ